MSAFALDRNLALMAGAGAGKTYSLVTICLHLLGGARAGGAVRPQHLCLLTFTDKAATELRGRLRARLEELAAGEKGAKDEPELAESFARVGSPFPPADVWRKLRDDLGAATVGTFHSLCVQLLRRAPAGFGVDPAFELLEERDAKRLLEECAERVVLDALEKEDPEVVALCADLGFSAKGFGGGLVEFLGSVYGKIREEGLEAKSVPVSDEDAAKADVAREISELRALLSKARSADLTDSKFKAVLAELEEPFSRFDVETLATSGAVAACRKPLTTPGLLTRKNGATPFVKELKYRTLGHDKPRVHGLMQRYAAILAAREERTFRRLLVELEERHRHELSRRAALDFSELLVRARDLLRVPAVRSEVQGRIGALLIDEFQDTNRLQLEIVTLLAEARDGAPRPVSAQGPIGDLPLQPGFLCAVGDRKQSIYEFRGADVSVFGELADRMEAQGGAKDFLKHNRRSSPPLLSFFNGLFKRVLKPAESPRDFEVHYAPEADDLLPVRESLLQEPPVERLLFDPTEDTETARQRDAEAVAKRIAALLADPSARVVDKDGTARRPRGGDVAILFRRFTYLELYRQELIRHDVPHRVIRGRGFYGAQEVMDLASLLSLLSDPYDALAFAALLRSPMVALSDRALFRLAHETGRLRSTDLAKRRLQGPLPITEEENLRLTRFTELFERLRKERDRLPLRVLLELAIAETGFRVALAGSPFGEQALVNVDKLLELAGQWDSTARGGCASFARELRQLAETEPAEAQAEVLDAGDPRAVQLCTIHAAKGLEWPVVVVPDLAARRKHDTERVRFDRRLGLAVRCRVGDDQESFSTPHLFSITEELRRRGAAEYGRLLYVALTRARDRLILSGQAATATEQTWRRQIDEALADDPILAHLVKDLRVDELPRAAPPELPVPAPDEGRLERAISRARTPPACRPSEATFPVTQLQDFFLCPRRYLYLHEVGLSEHPAILEVEAEAPASDGVGGQGAADPKRRGTLAHRLLERFDLSLVGRASPEATRKRLEELLGMEGVLPGDTGAGEILDAVEGFLATNFARGLQRAGATKVHRELPFLLRLGDGDFALHLKGQIDLLFEDKDGGATVVDYKFSRRHPGGLAAYAFQLDCYALAARNFVKDDVAVRTGISFLREGNREPELRAAARKLELHELEGRLVEGAKRLLEASRTHVWTGLPRERCQAMRCGYVYRCHGPASSGRNQLHLFGAPEGSERL